MPINGLRAFYYEAFPIKELDYFSVPPEKTGGVQTGGMSKEDFEALVESIREKGLINPVLVEDDNTKRKVQFGNNRCYAMLSLGEETIRTVLITKNSKPAPLPLANPIPLHQFHATMLLIHPGDENYLKSPYVRNIVRAFPQQMQPAVWALDRTKLARTR